MSIVECPKCHEFICDDCIITVKQNNGDILCEDCDWELNHKEEKQDD